MDRILSIDPGGKTGLYYKNGKKEEFLEINKPWKETYLNIKELVKERGINAVIFEDTNYIHKKTKDGLDLFRLLGSIECLEVEVNKINVLKVKELYKKLLESKEQIKDLVYTGQGRGHGWIYQGQRISIHQLDALLIYLLFKKNE